MGVVYGEWRGEEGFEGKHVTGLLGCWTVYLEGWMNLVPVFFRTCIQAGEVVSEGVGGMGSNLSISGAKGYNLSVQCFRLQENGKSKPSPSATQPLASKQGPLEAQVNPVSELQLQSWRGSDISKSQISIKERYVGPPFQAARILEDNLMINSRKMRLLFQEAIVAQCGREGSIAEQV